METGRPQRSAEDSRQRVATLSDEALTASVDDVRQAGFAPLDPVQRQRAWARLEARLFERTKTQVLLDRFVVLDYLGAGGQGRVYSAFDPRLDRKVAIKLLLPSTDLEAMSRVIREARTMASVADPNVATLFDVGRFEDDNGKGVFLVLELIEGPTLGEWLAQRRPWRAALAQVIAAGRGLAGAHAVGVVHGDFKPQNIMIAKDGRPRVLDFGLSIFRRDMPAGDDERTHGFVRGTPAYLAPEQLAGGGASPASDQYAFCVTLWEALVGTRPFSAKDFRELAVAKRAGPPAMPRDSHVPLRILELCRRGLDPDPRRRFSTMTDLLTALEAASSVHRRVAAIALGAGFAAAMLAWLQHTPAACDESANLFAPERRAAVEAAVVTTATPEARVTWDRIGPQLDEYARAWTDLHAQACASEPERSDGIRDRRMGCLRRAERAMRSTVDVLANADAQLVLYADDLVEELPSLDACERAEGAAVVAPPDPMQAAAVEAVRSQRALATTLRVGSELDRAAAALAEAQRLASGIDYPPLAGEIALEQGAIADAQGRYVDAATAWSHALDSATSAGQWAEASEASRRLAFVVGVRLAEPDRAMVYAEIARGLILRTRDPAAEPKLLSTQCALQLQRGTLSEARESCERALALFEEQQENDTSDTIDARAALGMVLVVQGELTFAVELLESLVDDFDRRFGKRHIRTANAHAMLGETLRRANDLDAAEAEIREALATLTEIAGPVHPLAGQWRSNLGAVLSARGRREAAMIEFREGLAIIEQTLPANHPHIAVARMNVGHALHADAKAREAALEFGGALVGMQSSFGPQHPLVAHARHNLGASLIDMGCYRAAEVHLRDSLAIRERVFGPAAVETAFTRHTLALSLNGQGRREEARAAVERGWTDLDALLGPDDPQVAVVTLALGVMMREDGDAAGSVQRLERVWPAQADREDPNTRAPIAYALALASFRVDPSAPTWRDFAERARAGYREFGARGSERLRELEAWIEAAEKRSPAASTWRVPLPPASADCPALEVAG